MKKCNTTPLNFEFFILLTKLIKYDIIKYRKKQRKSIKKEAKKMTVKNTILKVLFDNGMTLARAMKVMEKTIQKVQKELPEYEIKWDRAAEEYPGPVYAMILMIVEEIIAEDNTPAIPN